MGGARSAGTINLALVLIIALCIGGIGGYLASGAVPLGTPVRTDASMPIHYPEELSVENAWIVAGFSCPEPACTKTLLDCQNNLPRRICSWINEQLAKGRSGEDIRAAIVRQHGEKLNKRGEGRPE